MKEFVRLRVKRYVYLVTDDNEKKKAKETKQIYDKKNAQAY